MHANCRNPPASTPAARRAACAGAPGTALETIRKMQHCCPTHEAGELMAAGHSVTERPEGDQQKQCPRKTRRQLAHGRGECHAERSQHHGAPAKPETPLKCAKAHRLRAAGDDQGCRAMPGCQSDGQRNRDCRKAEQAGAPFCCFPIDTPKLMRQASGRRHRWFDAPSMPRRASSRSPQLLPAPTAEAALRNQPGSPSSLSGSSPAWPRRDP